MKTYSIVCLLVISVFTFGSKDARAQATCFGETFGNFRFCMESGINFCSSTFTTCDSTRSLITLEDVAELAIARCCSSNSQTVRNSCLNAEKRRYQKVIASFRNAVYNTIKNVQNNNCGVNSTPTPTPTSTPTVTPTSVEPTPTVAPTPTATATPTATPTP